MFGTEGSGTPSEGCGTPNESSALYSIFFFIFLFYPPVGQKLPENNDLNKNMSYQAHEILVLIAYANSKGFDETTCTHPCSFA